MSKKTRKQTDPSCFISSLLHWVNPAVWAPVTGNTTRLHDGEHLLAAALLTAS